MHTLVFLAPEHFHAALTLREQHPRVRDEVFVYAADEAEVREFMGLVASFNARPARPTRWQPVVGVGGDPLARFLAERPGDLVILAGKNDRKMGWIRRLHDAGFPVLADKPWMTGTAELADLRQTLSGPPLAMEMMTGRQEITTAVERMLVGVPDVFGTFAPEDGDAAIAFESVHHLEKRVNGAPLRRPPWFFDVRVQGDGLADIPTHLVDHAQQLVGGRESDEASDDGRAGAPGPALEMVAARCWPTPVPREVFARVSGLPDFPATFGGLVDGGHLDYLGNAEIVFRCGGVLVRASTRWELTEPPGGGDSHRARLRGTRSDIHVEQSAATGWKRRLVVEPRPDAAAVEDAVRRCVAACQGRLPGLTVTHAERGFELQVPAALRTPHESHFPLALDEFLGHVERGEWPTRRVADTLAKYELLAQARVLAGHTGRE
jgi:predicted dehydrogenase